MAHTTDEVPARRALAAVWLVGSSLIALPAFLLTVASDRPGDRAVGIVLAVLVMVGVVAASFSLNASATVRFRATLMASLMWFLSGVVVFGSQRHLIDAMWAGGLPILTALVAAATVLFSGRPPQVGG
jgi:hypothetical protein